MIINSPNGLITMVIELCSLLRTDEEVGGKPDVCTNTAARLRRHKTDRASCNLDCSYCFFLSKELLYDQKTQRMSEETLEQFAYSFLAANPDGPVTFLWQGGEPTLRGIDFFKRAVELGKQYCRPAQMVRHAIQTNGTLIDEEWAQFFAANNFLVGISLDGPAALHDIYRTNRAGRATHAQVVRGWQYLQDAGVETNILSTVHAANQDHPLEVYRYFRDELQARYIQFIPIVERVREQQLHAVERGWNAQTGILYRQDGTAVTSRSVSPEKYGTFLSTIFDEWIRNDVGDVFVQDFDSALSALFSRRRYACMHPNAETTSRSNSMATFTHATTGLNQIGNSAISTNRACRLSPRPKQCAPSRERSAQSYRKRVAVAR